MSFRPLQHWIRLELFPDVLVHRLKMMVDPADSSYMPSLVVVSGGLDLRCSLYIYKLDYFIWTDAQTIWSWVLEKSLNLTVFFPLNTQAEAL